MDYDKSFDITLNMMNRLASITGKLSEIKFYQNLDKLPHLRKQNRIKSIYSSCAIEANSLSLNEVSDIINGIKVIGDEKEIIEVKNAIRAYDIIEEINPYEVNDLLKIHGILTKSLVDRSLMFRLNNEGVFDGDRCIFIAPPPDLVPGLVDDLFGFLNENQDEINPVILSSIFHYELVFIHPFQDGNGRTVRLLQMAILGKYNEIFYYLPIENEIMNCQNEYYETIKKCNLVGKSTYFIEFMLAVIDDTLSKAMIDIKRNTVKKTIYIDKLMKVMKVGEALTSKEILDRLGLKSKETLRKNYLGPAIELDLVELELKDKLSSRNQRYIRKI